MQQINNQKIKNIHKNIRLLIFMLRRKCKNWLEIKNKLGKEKMQMLNKLYKCKKNICKWVNKN